MNPIQTIREALEFYAIIDHSAEQALAALTELERTHYTAAPVAQQPQAEPLCEDEGCPHSGTKHVCISPPQAVAVLPGWTFKRLSDGSIGIHAPAPKPGEKYQRTSDCVTPGHGDTYEILSRLVDHLEAPQQAEAPTFTVDDSDLNNLLNAAASMVEGQANHDTGMWFLQALEKVQARLKPQPEAVRFDIELLRELRDNCQASIAETSITPEQTQYRKDLYWRASKAVARAAIAQQKTNESRPKTCPNKFKPDGTYSGCQLHNLHCAYPNCEKP